MLAGTVSRRPIGNNKEASFSSVTAGLKALLHTIQEADLPPTEQAKQAVKKLTTDFKVLEEKWILFTNTKTTEK